MMNVFKHFKVHDISHFIFFSLGPNVPQVSKFKVSKEQGLALAGNIELKNIDERCSFDCGDAVIGTALLTSCVRNVWTLVSFKDEDWTDRQIRYGDSLCIKLYKSDPPLYVEAPVVTPFAPRGECGYPAPKLTLWKTAYTRYTKNIPQKKRPSFAN